MELTPTVERSWVEIVSDNDPDTSYLYQHDPDFSERREAYERGDFHFVGVQACAEIRFKTPQGGYQGGPIVRSPGRWGIESDSGEDYFTEIGEEEQHELADMLAALGIKTTPEALKRNASLNYR